MKSLIIALALSATVTPLSTTTTTNSGQPIVLPAGPVQVSASTVSIPKGVTLPLHKHPYPRYALVQQGRIRVTNTDTGGVVEFGKGEFVVEALGQWHTGEALEDVVLFVIDQAPPGEANTVRKD
jgi:quercetin dioxygenase-like cupin family protein